MNRFILAEPQNCIGCRTCEVACAMAHPLALSADALSPSNFRPRLKVIVGAKISTAVMCRHCEDAPCAKACPSGAIVFSNDSVQVLQERCVGCKSCMVACPYGAMDVVTAKVEPAAGSFFTSQSPKSMAIKCDLCVTRAAGPACISSCPTKALHLVDKNKLESTMKARQEQAALVSPLVQL